MTINSLAGLTGLAGINALEEDNPDATPEQRMGGPANPFHSHAGETARPYSWQSPLTQAGGPHGPYGPENQMLGDEMWFIEPGGVPSEDPSFDYNSPNISRSHASVHNITNSGAIPSLASAIDEQISQMGNHASDLGTSRRMSYDETLEAVQDQWDEIWEINPGHTDIPKAPGAIGNNAFGVGVNDRPTNAYAKRNSYGFDSSHMHRRYATGSIPGNTYWMRPAGRPLFKTLAGPSRPAIGANSPFEGDDLGTAFGIDGAILQTQPESYIPPPTPYLATPTPQYANPMGTNGVDLW